MSALAVIPRVLSSLFWDRSQTWKSFIRPGWLANQSDRVPRHLPVATSLELGLSANHYAMCIYVGSEIELTTSCFPAGTVSPDPAYQLVLIVFALSGILGSS